jgi:hypothetical protein
MKHFEYLDPAETIALIDSLYADIVCVLTSAANVYVPRHSKSFHKFWWDEELDLLKDESIGSKINCGKRRESLDMVQSLINGSLADYAIVNEIKKANNPLYLLILMNCTMH